MPRDARRFVGVALLATAALSLIAGLLPLMRGGRPHVVFLGVAVVWLVLGLTRLRRGEPPGRGPAA